MMTRPILLVPGYQNSPEDHWQTWIENKIPRAERLAHLDWNAPKLTHWAEQIHNNLIQRSEPVILVAHSFGVLASVVAINKAPHCIHRCILVAPASPARFNLEGLSPQRSHKDKHLADQLPYRLGVAGLVVGSQNDPWMPATEAEYWANRWQLNYRDEGLAGHINGASGYGPWPFIQQQLRHYQQE